jgi:hypothetical protein
MSDAMNKMVTAAFKEADSYEMVESMGYAWPGAERFARLLAAALAAAPTVQGYVLCEGHHVAPIGHCYSHGSKFCGDPACGPCPGPFQDLIARTRTPSA